MNPGVATPADIQVREFPLTLAHPCPTCHAAAGEPCLPTSLAVPHTARVGILSLEAAEVALARAIRAVDADVWGVSYTENDDGTLALTRLDCGPRGTYHPDSPEFDRVAAATPVVAAMTALTEAGAGTDTLNVRSW